MFYGANRPGAKVSQGILDQFWLWSMQAGLKNAYESIKAFSETDFTEDLKKFDVPTLVLHGEDDQIVPVKDSARKSAQAHQGREGHLLSGRAARHHGHASGSGQRRSAGLPPKLAFGSCELRNGPILRSRDCVMPARCGSDNVPPLGLNRRTRRRAPAYQRLSAVTGKPDNTRYSHRPCAAPPVMTGTITIYNAHWYGKCGKDPLDGAQSTVASLAEAAAGSRPRSCAPRWSRHDQGCRDPGRIEARSMKF